LLDVKEEHMMYNQENKGGEWIKKKEKWGEFNYIVNTFINVTMYPPYNNTIKIKLKNIQTDAEVTKSLELADKKVKVTIKIC
jgi:hypothetical protein